MKDKLEYGLCSPVYDKELAEKFRKKNPKATAALMKAYLKKEKKSLGYFHEGNNKSKIGKGGI